MRRYDSFFVQTWIDVIADGEDVCRFKVEHIQSGAVIVVNDLRELAGWLQQHMGGTSHPASSAEPLGLSSTPIKSV